MRALRGRRGAVAAVAVLVVAVAATACSNATNVAGNDGATAPGVTSKQINVGALGTLSGGLAADFQPIVPGVEAYFDMVNAEGGVDGRKLDLAYKLDDGSNPTTDADLARTLVQQDHVFAVVGVATAFFGGATFLAQTHTPTFGYATENDWSPAPNLFAAYGSVVTFTTSEPFFAYVAKEVHATSAAVIAYNVPQSADECQGAVAAFKEYGIHVGYTDLSVQYGSDLSSDVVHMKQHGVDFVISCMDVQGNVTLSRELQQNGVTGVKQLWLDGYDQSTLNQYSSLMQGTYFLVQHVPFQAEKQFPGEFPGLQKYISVMNKYEPAYTDNEVAMEGWLSAALFTAGVRAVGPDLTQKKLVDAINKITDFTGDGLTSPVNWKYAHTIPTPPTCYSFVETVGDSFRVVFNRGKAIWVCFPIKGKADLNRPLPAPAGTPGT